MCSIFFDDEGNVGVSIGNNMGITSNGDPMIKIGNNIGVNINTGKPGFIIGFGDDDED